jgi:hypothetical protein
MAHGAALERSVLGRDVAALRNSLAHLERSNAELRAAIAQGDDDPEFRQVGERRFTFSNLRAATMAGGG